MFANQLPNPPPLMRCRSEGLGRSFPALCALALALSLLTSGAVGQSNSWIVSLEDGAPESSLAGIQSIYSSAGLTTSSSTEGGGAAKQDILEIGSLRLMIAPAGDAALRDQLERAPGVAGIEAQEEWSLLPIAESEDVGPAEDANESLDAAANEEENESGGQRGGDDGRSGGDGESKEGGAKEGNGREGGGERKGGGESGGGGRGGRRMPPTMPPPGRGGNKGGKNSTAGGLNPARELNREAAKQPQETAVLGKGVVIFVIDTGVDVKHPAFRSTDGSKKTRATVINFTNETSADLNGHGTHVAGTAAGLEFGIARGAQVVGLKVLGKSGGGSNVAILRSLAFVAKQQAERKNGPAVINMSLGGPRPKQGVGRGGGGGGGGGGARRGNGNDQDTAIRRAIQEVTKLNVAVVVAAGNSGKDACGFTPAFVKEAITVAASNGTRLAKFSNSGSCVDVIAPGVKLISAKAGGGRKLSSGTSMASPVAAGTMAVLMGEGLSVQAAEKRLVGQVAQGEVRDPKGTPNRVLTPGEIAGAASAAERRARNGEGATAFGTNSQSGSGSAELVVHAGKILRLAVVAFSMGLASLVPVI